MKVNSIFDFKKNLTPTKLIVSGYAALVIVGTILLMLPFSTRSGVSTSFMDAFFTATSASCVTGLVIFDTYTYWSLFGQLVILLLIQVGGMGFMTIAISALTFTKKKIGLQQRFIMQESISAPQLGGIVRMTKFIFMGIIGFELVGALLMSFSFCREFGFAKGLYFSVFHSISAFCNGGFDLMGGRSEFSSITTLSGDYLVNIVLMLLIIIGGLGFFVWSDLLENKFNLKKCNLHSKVVLFTSIILVFAGSFLLFFLELDNASTAEFSMGEKILHSFFQSVSARTAGFASVDLTLMSDGGLYVMILLMFIGGSPGSTAGGIKTTTAAILFLSIFAEFKNKKSIECFNRRIDNSAFRRACCIAVSFLLLISAATLGICAIDKVPLKECLFETVSALSTVGLSLGMTPTLSVGSHIILICLMFIGRVGGITLLLALGNHVIETPSNLPAEKISVG